MVFIACSSGRLEGVWVVLLCPYHRLLLGWQWKNLVNGGQLLLAANMCITEGIKKLRAMPVVQ